MKIKSAALLLIVASFVWLVDLLYYTYERFAGENAKYYADKPLEMVIPTSMLIMPIGFLIFSFAVYNKKPKMFAAPVTDDVQTEGLLTLETPNISMGKWLGTFLITIIPVVGIVFLIIWSLDKNNPIRKNWAAASLVWLVVQVFFFFFIFYSLYGRLYN